MPPVLPVGWPKGPKLWLACAVPVEGLTAATSSPCRSAMIEAALAPVAVGLAARAPPFWPGVREMFQPPTLEGSSSPGAYCARLPAVVAPLPPVCSRRSSAS
jgi:hypothetical protein